MNSLQFDSKLTFLPIIHGSAAYATAVRQFLLESPTHCVAIPLPPSFRTPVVRGVEELPTISTVVQLISKQSDTPDTDDEDFATWNSHDSNEDAEESSEEPETSEQATYVPIDPCQSVIAAIRFAVAEGIHIEFIDSNSEHYTPNQWLAPDPLALNFTSVERFAATILPSIPPPSDERRDRIDAMALNLIRLRQRYQHTTCLCEIQDWPYLRQRVSQLASLSAAEQAQQIDEFQLFESDTVNPPENYAVDSRTLFFMLAELPFITGLYERARATLDDDRATVIDGLKELFIAARQSYMVDLGRRARRITPLSLAQCLKYVRNQTLLDRRMSPEFYTIARSAQQILGDQFTIHLVEAARNYPYEESLPWPTLKMGVDQAILPNTGKCSMTSRLPGPPIVWKHLELTRPPQKLDQRKWTKRWNPYSQCSWPEEDVRIESFRNRLMERARAALGADLARTEKFTTSMMDGLDLRETLRHWYDGSLYVKIQPPTIGELDATVMLFENDPDPREYSWRTTWFAEHQDESTLAFYATPFQKEILGPGVAVSTYGGALFLYPPRGIKDIWNDPALNIADTIEQRLVAAACYHSRSNHVALLSGPQPGLALKKIAKTFRKKLVHVPLSQFADSVVQQLRTFHVLNGQHVRSYAAHFIRRP